MRVLVLRKSHCTCYSWIISRVSCIFPREAMSRLPPSPAASSTANTGRNSQPSVEPENPSPSIEDAQSVGLWKRHEEIATSSPLVFQMSKLMRRKEKGLSQPGHRVTGRLLSSCIWLSDLPISAHGKLCYLPLGWGGGFLTFLFVG